MASRAAAAVIQLVQSATTVGGYGVSDRDLLRRFADGNDQAAFAALVRRHTEMVLGVCRRALTNQQDAEDACQATFLVLAQKAKSNRWQPSVANWLFTTARKVARNARIAAQRRARWELRAALPEAVQPVDQLTGRELLTALDEELDKLPPRYREPLVLCYLEGLTRDEAAKQLAVPAATLKTRLERGRKRLGDALTRRGCALGAGLLALGATSPARASSSHLIESILATTSGSTPATVATLAKGVAVNGLMNKSVLLVLALVGATALGVGLRRGPVTVAGQQPDQRTHAPVDSPAASNAQGKPRPENATKPKGAEVGLVVRRTALAASQAPEQLRLDRYGDPLPPGAVARLGTVRFRAPDEADALAFARDGKTIAVSSRGGLFLFAADSGKQVKRLADHAFAGRQQNTLAFSPDGKRLAAWGQGAVSDGKGNRGAKDGVCVWELAGERQPQEYDAEHLIWLGWSSDSKPLAVCLEKGAVSLRELASGRSRRFECRDLRRPELSDSVLCACAPDGRTLAVADDNSTIHVWDTATGAERCTVSPNQDDTLRGLALSPDGRHLATLQQGSAAPYRHAVHIWDARAGRALRTVAADHKNMSTLVFAPDGKTLATAGWNGIRCVDVATGRERSRSEGEGSNTEKIAFSGDGQTLATLQGHSGAFHVWDAATGKRNAEPVGHLCRPYGMSFSPDGRRLASGGALDGTIHIWDLATSQSLFNIHRDSWVRRAEFSRDGRSLFSTWTDDKLWISDAATGERQHVIKLEDPERPDTYQSAISMHLAADGKTLVAFSYYYAKKGGAGPSYDETLITGWDPATRKQLFRRRLPGTGSNAVSADVRLLAVAYPSPKFEREGPGRGPMRLEELATGQLLLRFPYVEGQTQPLAFAPDGRLLASVNYNYNRHKEGDPASTGASVLLFEVATAAEVLSLPLAGQSRVAFSPNGRLLAMTAPERDIVVWDLVQGRELRRFKGLDAEVTWLAFAPDGRRLVSGQADSTLLIWDIGAPRAPKTGKVAAEALAKAWDELGGSDAPRAFQAQWALVSVPDATLALFQKHLKPAQPADPRRLQTLIDHLDSPQFTVRSAANKELEQLGDLAAGALRQALAKNPSLELRRRTEALLDKLNGPVTRPHVLQAVRASAVLEHIASPEARKLLETFAQGAPEARLTQEAQAALKRLGTQ